MLTDAELRKMLADFVGRQKPTVLGAVTAVDEQAGTCDIDDDGAMYYDVRLQCIAPNTHGIRLLPKIGSLAIALQVEDRDEWMLVSAAEYDTIKIDADTLLQINGGANGGLAIIGVLIERINRLETALKDHQHGYIPYPGGAAGPPVATTPATALAPPDTTLVFDNTTREELENTKVTH
jgi:hypothetical protein